MAKAKAVLETVVTSGLDVISGLVTSGLDATIGLFNVRRNYLLPRS